MARTPRQIEQRGKGQSPETLTDILFPLLDGDERDELEAFRKEYEALNGPTDLTKRYTSMLPEPQQDWLYEHETKRWFDGLPPFARAFMKGKLEIAARDGDLDDMPDEMVALYVSGELDRRPIRGR
jgi:hypothetical protein